MLDGVLVFATVLAVGLPILLLIKKQLDDTESWYVNNQIAFFIHIVLFFYVTMVTTIAVASHL